MDRESEESVRYEEANGWQASASLTPMSNTKLGGRQSGLNRTGDVTHEPSSLKAASKPSMPFWSSGPAILRIGHRLWDKNARTDIYWYRNTPDMPREVGEGRRAHQQRGLHNKNLSRCLFDHCEKHS